MRSFILTAGAIFGLIALAHAWRLLLEPHLAREPWFMALTLVSAGLAAWAFRVYRRLPKA